MLHYEKSLKALHLSDSYYYSWLFTLLMDWLLICTFIRLFIRRVFRSLTWNILFFTHAWTFQPKILMLVKKTSSMNTFCSVHLLNISWNRLWKLFWHFNNSLWRQKIYMNHSQCIFSMKLTYFATSENDDLKRHFIIIIIIHDYSSY